MFDKPYNVDHETIDKTAKRRTRTSGGESGAAVKRSSIPNSDRDDGEGRGDGDGDEKEIAS